MTNNHLLINVDKQGIATITLNRPELHNAFDDVLIKNLTQELKRLESDSKVGVILLVANGKSFSAGADLNWMRRMANYSMEENVRDAMALANLMQALNQLKKPTIALVQGAAFGGGVGLVACCDIAIASEQASFCLSEVKIGLIPAVISPYVIAAIGERAARRYFLSAERFDVKEAHRLGLVHEVVAGDKLMETGQQFAENLLKNSPQAMQKTKQLIARVSRSEIDSALIQETVNAIAEVRVSKEGQEGLTAFLEKRDPSWSTKRSGLTN